MSNGCLIQLKRRLISQLDYQLSVFFQTLLVNCIAFQICCSFKNYIFLLIANRNIFRFCPLTSLTINFGILLITPFGYTLLYLTPLKSQKISPARRAKHRPI